MMNISQNNSSDSLDYLAPPVIDPFTSVVIDINNPEPLNDKQLKTGDSFLTQLKLFTSTKELQLKEKTTLSGASYSYDLPIPFSFTNGFAITKDNQIKGYLYSIRLIPQSFNQSEDPRSTVGFLFPSILGCDTSFKLSKLNEEIYTCFINKVNTVFFTYNEICSLITYHLKVLSDYNKTFHLDVFNMKSIINDYYLRIISASSKEKKYLIVPIVKFNSSYIIHWKRIFKAEKMIHQPNLINTVTNNNLEKKLNKRVKTKDKDGLINSTWKLNKKIYYALYSNKQYFELIDIIYANDNGDTFLNKITQYDTNTKQEWLLKYFPSNSNVLNLTAKEIMNYCTTSMIAINTFRTLPQKYGINLNRNPIAYIYGRLCNFNDTLFSYKKKQIHGKEPKNQVYSIYPISSVDSTYMLAKDYEIIRNISSICINLEQSVIPLSLIRFVFLKNLTIINSQYFKWACTSPSLCQDYDYQTLETLGDSILKMFITIQLIYKDDIEEDPDKKRTVGELEKRKASLINNKYLFKRGKKKKLYQYIISEPFNKDTWLFPLLNTAEQVYHQAISPKTMADFAEAIIGACYLYDSNIFDSFSFIQEMSLYTHPIEKQTKIYSFVYQKLKGLSIKSIATTFVDLNPDISFKEIMQLNNIDYQPINSFSELEKVIGYSFKSKQLLYKAFTHESMVYSIENSYEKFELLGDAIVEVYIMLAIMNIYKDIQYNCNGSKCPNSIDSNCFEKIKSNADYISCCSLTRIKSFLCSNSFMCKIGAFLSFHNLLFIAKYYKYSEPLAEFSNEDNLKLLINQKLNEYNSTQTTHPKFIADVFEALIGAIFLDGDIKECFKVLTLLYGHFINYCAYYMKDIKYSAISDFNELATEKMKSFPKFITKTNDSDSEFINEECLVEVFINDKLFCVGKGKSNENAKLNAAEIGLTKLLKAS